MNSQNTERYQSLEGALGCAMILPSEQEWTDYLLDCMAYSGWAYGRREGNELFTSYKFYWNSKGGMSSYED